MFSGRGSERKNRRESSIRIKKERIGLEYPQGVCIYNAYTKTLNTFGNFLDNFKCPGVYRHLICNEVHVRLIDYAAYSEHTSGLLSSASSVDAGPAVVESAAVSA